MPRSAPLNFSIVAADPAWYGAQAASTWFAHSTGPAPTLANVGAVAHAVSAWASLAILGSAAYHALCGGHDDGSDNPCFKFDLNVAVPRWQLMVASSTVQPQRVAYYTDGKPAPRHEYDNVCGIPALAGSTNGNRWFSPWMFSVPGPGFDHFPKASSYSVDNNAYDPQNFFPDYPLVSDLTSCYNGWSVWDPVTERVWVCAGAGGFFDLRSFDPRTKTYSASFGTQSPRPDGTGPWTTALCDPSRRVLVAIQGNTLYVHDLQNPSVMRAYTIAGMDVSGAGWEYEPTSRKWCMWDNSGKTLRIINPPTNYRTGDGSTSNPLNASATYAFTQTITPSTGATPPNSVNGTFGRLAYIAQPKSLLLLSTVDQAVHTFKIPAGGL